MRKTICIRLLIVSIFFIANSLNAQWINTNGPGDKSLAASGTYIFSGTSAGVYRSTNNGGSWTYIGLSNHFINALAISGSNLVAGTDDGVFRSTNYGSTWVDSAWNSNAYPYLSVEFFSLAFCGNIIFAGGYDAFLKSTDGGHEWIGSGLTWYDVPALAVSGANIYAGTGNGEDGGGVFLSTDNGNGWANLGLKDTYVISLAVSGTNIYAGTYGSGIFLSTNNGANWTAINSGLASTTIYTIAISNNGVFIGVDGGVFLSTNNGTSWTAADSGLGSNPVHALIVSGTNLFASDSTVWRRPLLPNISPGDSGLVAYYPFSGNTLDATGHGHDGTIVGNVSYVTDMDGHAERALQFDGTSGYVRVDSVRGLSLQTYTITAIIKPDDFLTNRGVLTRPSPSNCTIYFYSSSILRGWPLVGWDKPIGGWTYGVIQVDPIDTTTFTHIAVSLGGGLMKGYVNGILQKSFSVADSDIPVLTNTPLYIGLGYATSSTKDMYFKGVIDEVRIYNRVLSDSEIAVTYNYGSPLPIQLASFTASALGMNKVLLEWLTVSEVNNYGFYVERHPQNNPTFVTISDLIPGAGNSLEEHHYSWTDSTATSGSYVYRLRQVDLTGGVAYSQPITVNGVTSVNDETAPRVFQLIQNYPNPFNPTTVIEFSVEKLEHATLKVYNMLGQEVAQLFDGMAEPGHYYKFNFDGSQIGSGMYFYRIITDSHTAVRKMLLLK